MNRHTITAHRLSGQNIPREAFTLTPTFHTKSFPSAIIRSGAVHICHHDRRVILRSNAAKRGLDAPRGGIPGSQVEHPHRMQLARPVMPHGHGLPLMAGPGEITPLHV